MLVMASFNGYTTNLNTGIYFNW